MNDRRKGKVQLRDLLNRVVFLNPDATEGAVIGENLRLPDGTIPTAEQVLGTGQQQTPGIASTLWRLIREIPANIVKLAALAGVGFTTRDAAGDWHQREIVAGDPLIVVNQGDGQAGNPTIASGSILHEEASPANPWTINHNLGRRPNVGVYTPGGVGMIAEVLHTSDSQVLVLFDGDTAGYALID